VTVDAVIPEKVFGEVLDTNLFYLRPAGFSALDLSHSLAQEPGRFRPAGLAEGFPGEMVFDP